MSSKPSEIAKALFGEQKYTCSQAVFAAYGEYLSNGKLDQETCMKIASAFSGGVAGLGNICGGLNGALMAIGLKYGGASQEAYNKVNAVARQLLDEFTTFHGSIMCRELINHDLHTDADIDHAFKTGAFDNCPKFIEDITVILDKLL
ncbi:MAG: C-GCAxxG-C-C family protein [Promethearchaeota archaeon]